jgi:hypothetical protein
MDPVASQVDAILDRYRANLRTYGVDINLRAFGEHAATIEVDHAWGANSCAGECGIPLPALLNLLQAELSRVAGLERVRWTAPPAAANGGP